MVLHTNITIVYSKVEGALIRNVGVFILSVLFQICKSYKYNYSCKKNSKSFTLQTVKISYIWLRTAMYFYATVSSTCCQKGVNKLNRDSNVINISTLFPPFMSCAQVNIVNNYRFTQLLFSQHDHAKFTANSVFMQPAQQHSHIADGVC